MKNIEDREIISKYLSLRSCRKVAEYYDCGHETVRQVLINHNISRVKPKQSKKEPKYHLNVYTDAELIEAYEKYGSQTLAGEKLGVSQTTVGMPLSCIFPSTSILRFVLHTFGSSMLHRSSS